MASLTWKSLAVGQLPSSKGTLYTVPAVTQTAVKSMSFTNNGVGVNKVDIYLKLLGGTIEAHVVSITLGAGDHLTIDDIGEFTAADLIEGSATNAAQVDYAISGGEVA